MTYIVELIKFDHGSFYHLYNLSILPEYVRQDPNFFILEEIFKREKNLGMTLNNLKIIILKEVRD